MSDYDTRYGDNWSEVSRRAKELIQWRCSYPGCNEQCSETHHAIYADLDGAIAGREIPGVHIFPLCDRHHSADDLSGAHHWRNYRKSNKNPVLENHNTLEYYLKLRQGWSEKRWRQSVHIINKVNL